MDDRNNHQRLKLLDRWRTMWNELGIVDINFNLFDRLINCYSEPHRRYHNLQHLEECLILFSECRSNLLYPQKIELAIWFHDAIYDVKSKDNEQKSASWAKVEILKNGLSTIVADRVYTAIMATKHDRICSDSDLQIIVDIDLAILGASSRRFDEYECQIRSEYSWVSESIFRQERRKILQVFLDRSRIFQTQYFFNLYEDKARENLRRSI